MDNFIVLNVGGQVFVTAKETLLVKDSYFEKRFSGTMDPGFELDGAAFIDRSPVLFAHILEFLRKQEKWYVPDSLEVLCELVEEARFYGLDALIAHIKEKVKPKAESFDIYLKGGFHGITDVFYTNDTAVGINKCFLPQDGTTTKAGQWYKTSLPYYGALSMLDSSFYPQYKLKHVYDSNDVKTLCYVDRYEGPVADELRRRLYISYSFVSA